MLPHMRTHLQFADLHGTFSYLQVVCFDSGVVQQHRGSSVSRAHAESFHDPENEIFGCLEFLFVERFRTIQQERQVHRAVARALRHESGEGQGCEGAVGRRRCGSGEHGVRRTNLTAQGVVVTVA